MADDLAGLLRPDGSVVVPPAAAGEVLRLLARALLADARTYGGRPSPAARAILAALYDATQHAAGTQDQAPAPATITVTDAAARMGCSTRWVRHLLAAGRLAGHRTAGGMWLVRWPAVPTSEASDRAARSSAA